MSQPQWIGEPPGGRFLGTGFRQLVSKRSREEEAPPTPSQASSSSETVTLVQGPGAAAKKAMPRRPQWVAKPKAVPKVSPSPLDTGIPPPPPGNWGKDPGVANWGVPGHDPRGSTGLTPRLEDKPVGAPAVETLEEEEEDLADYDETQPDWDAP